MNQELREKIAEIQHDPPCPKCRWWDKQGHFCFVGKFLTDDSCPLTESILALIQSEPVPTEAELTDEELATLLKPYLGGQDVNEIHELIAQAATRKALAYSQGQAEQARVDERKAIGEWFANNCLVILGAALSDLKSGNRPD